MSETKATVKEKTIQILKELSEEERKVFSAVLKIERDRLHQKKPHRMKEDLLKVVRDLIKEVP